MRRLHQDGCLLNRLQFLIVNNYNYRSCIADNEIKYTTKGFHRFLKEFLSRYETLLYRYANGACSKSVLMIRVYHILATGI